MIQTVSLSDICTKITSGGTPLTKRDDYYGGGIPWLRTQEVNFGNIYSTEKTITELGLKNSSAKIIPEDSVIVAMYGATAGRSAINKIPLATNQACCNLIIDNNKADYRFVYYYLVNSYEKLLSAAVGAAQQNLGSKQISAMTINLPPLDQQKKIADILSSLDEKIELNRHMNETLEQLGQTLFRHYFVDKAKQSNGNIQTIPLGKKFHPKRGRSLQARDMICGDTPVISGGLKPAGFHNEANTTAPVITISASGANAGFVSVWGEPVWSADSSYIDSTITKYVYTYYLFLKNKQKEIYDMQTGSGQPHIYPKHIELLEIVDLSDCEFDDFEQMVRPLFDMIHENKKQIDYLSKIRDLLLPKLISGEIKI
ncbi:restriction endonuclease subunit S [Candidatus Minimicrobia vallesae]|uniref:restriction endonuclease subunit S n=1 Tax=Candidatus Minimicrobia vallesae TaxID=2841264 RepID=UPI001E4D3B5F|nr:restriction endonuclease subunit S [Candidatus Minimicrobia vallesae]